MVPGRNYGSQGTDERRQVRPEIRGQDSKPQERAAVLSEEGYCEKA